MLDGPREKKDPEISILNNWAVFGINKNRISGEKGNVQKNDNEVCFRWQFSESRVEWQGHIQISG